MDDFQRKIIEAAVRAPSGDNCQPWTFRFPSLDRLEIRIIPALAESFFDVELRATCISMGAAIENIRVASEYYRFAMDVEYAEPVGSEGPSAVIHFHQNRPCPPRTEDAFRALMARTVNRRPFLPRLLDPVIWRQLFDVETPDDVSVVSYTGAERDQWIPALVAADIIRWSHPKIHAELFEKIRYTAAEAAEKRDGLEIDRLGVGPGARWVMSFLSSWSRQQKLNTIGGARVLAGQTAGLARASAGLVGLWVKDDSERSWIRGGEITQRLWNRAHELGLAVQPVSLAFYLKRRADREGLAAFTAMHQRTLPQISEVVERFARKNIINRIPVMLFRIGKAMPMKTTAVRKPVESFV